MKICLDYGHNLQGSDTGAQGNGYKEEVLTRLVGKKVKNILEENGHKVIESIADRKVFNSVQDSLYARYSTSNSNVIDLFVSINFNAYNGKAQGTEVYTYNSRDIPQARQILNNIVELGYVNRGIKDGSKLAVIKNTKATALLIECCFIDNKSDMDKFNADKMANAIAFGIMGKKTENALEDAKKFLGNRTKELQEKLIKVGYNVGKNGPDGVFGEDTLNALKSYQKNNGLTPDGLAGPATFKKIDDYIARVFAPPKLDLKSEMLRIRKELDNLIAKM